MSAPERIWLQDGGDYDACEILGEVTWCVDKVDDTDTEYVRADTHRAEIDAVEPNRPVLPGVMPRYFAVWSATGVHVGIWDDGPTAAKVLGEYPGGVMRDLFEGETVQSQIDAAVAAERERCAAIAEQIGDAYGDDETGWFECSEVTAEAIRKGGQP